jgi:hypothetical protein
MVLRERWSLSLRGSLLLLFFLASSMLLVCWKIHPFLALTRPVSSVYLIVEGWIPDYALDEAVNEYKRGGYQKLLTCGGITKDGWRDTPKYTAADWSAARLRKYGLTNGVVAIPCLTEQYDRTYHSAVAVKKWFDDNGEAVRSINVVTLGPHARRTRLLFEKAFGSNVRVGIIALVDRDYDPDRWWQSSEGARSIVGEVIAYVYVRVFFWPSFGHVPVQKSAAFELPLQGNDG